MNDQASRVTEMLKALSKKGKSAGGLAPLLQMLNNMDRGSEKQIIDAIKQQNPQLAKQLEEQYFSFEDIVNMDDKVVKRALEEVHKTTLALALKGVDANVKMKVMNNLSDRAADILQDDIDVMGPQPKQLVEDAQREVTKTLRSWKDVIIQGGRITVQSVLNTIAKQANLERILFSPGLKKMYFELAVSAGGAATFKHADSIRNGLTTTIKDLDREKKSLLFCHTHELIPAYDIMIHAAVDMHSVAVLAVRGGKSPAGVYWSDLELLRNGWVVFHTHTLQELYDHLAISYHIYAEKKFSLPVLIVHSSLRHKSMGDWNEKEGVNLGAPTGDFTAKKTGPKSFADAFAAMEKKKSPPSLQGEIDKVVPALRDVYQEFGYSLPESGLPYQGSFSANDIAVISQIPAEDEAALEDAHFDFIRPLCIRPLANDSLTSQLQQKKSIIIVETEPTPGNTIPPYFAEWCAALQSGFNGDIQSATLPVGTTVLKSSELKSITKTQPQFGQSPLK